jgi:serine/threonine protein kinase/tetratricopeptide (TPR) repeat protein
MKCPKCRHENPPDSMYCGKCSTRLDPRGADAGPVFTETLETAREELTTGSTFAGRYQVIEELGQGGMGRVYKVHDTKVGEKIALKLIRPEAGLDRKSLERFSNELKLARKVRHKNVCQMFDLGEDRGVRYITMEYVRGEDLRQLIRKVGRLSPGQTVAIARQVCAGLEEAHKLNVVHRDLKPQNIMLDEDGSARIMDFGIARSLAGKSTTGAGVLIGTPEYMSPEQVEGKDVDQRSDIYSLGVILYEMVTGRRPFDGETPLSIAHKQRYEAPEDPRKINPQVPDGLARVILKCLEKDKAARYESARALDADLAGIEEGLPTAERAAPKRKGGTTKDLTVTFNLRKLFVPALAVLVLIGAAFVVWKIVGGRKPAPAAASSSGKPSVAVMYFENQTEKPGLDKMLVTLLTTNLSRNQDIEVTSTQRLFDILKLLGRQDVQTIDRSLATDVATRAGVKAMLLGSIIQIGPQIRLASQLIDVKTGSILGTQSADGTKYEDLFTMADGITAQVGNYFGGGGSGPGLKVADVTTSSLEALDSYQKGRDRMLRWDYPGARKHLAKAVEIDPTFAMAHAYLAMTQLGNPSSVFGLYTDLTEAKRTLGSARRHSARATESERILIRLTEALFDRDPAKAAAFGRELLARNIPEKWAYYAIEFAHWFNGDFAAAIRTAEQALESDPTDGISYSTLGYSYSFLDDFPAAISAIKKYMAVQPDVSNAYDSAWEISMQAGRFDEALGYADEAMRTHPAWTFLESQAGWSLIHLGRGEAARERFRRRAQSAPSQAPNAAIDVGLSYLREGRRRDSEAELFRALDMFQKDGRKYYEIRCRFRLCEIFLIRGKFAEALAQADEAEKISGAVYPFDFNPIPLTRRFYAGRVFVADRELEKAAAAAEEARGIVKGHGMAPDYLVFSDLLEAEIAMAQNKPEEALRALDRTDMRGWWASPFYWRTKAAAEEALGRFESAVGSFKEFQGNVKIAKQDICDPVRYFHELSLVDYNLGRIAEKTGDPAAAKDHYRKFLEGMKAADPGIPEVADAQQRLAALK